MPFVAKSNTNKTFQLQSVQRIEKIPIKWREGQGMGGENALGMLRDTRLKGIKFHFQFSSQLLSLEDSQQNWSACVAAIPQLPFRVTFYLLLLGIPG